MSRYHDVPHGHVNSEAQRDAKCTRQKSDSCSHPFHHRQLGLLNAQRHHRPHQPPPREQMRLPSPPRTCHTLTLPLPPTTALPAATERLLTHPQSHDSILHLTAIPSATPVQKRDASFIYPPSTPTTQHFYPLSAGVPRALHALHYRGLLSLQPHPRRHAIRITLLPGALDAQPLLLPLIRFFCRASAGPCRRRDPQWAYDTVRRTPSDADHAQLHPFLARVARLQSLNVTLRAYQQRAVAWMLSRELAPPRDIVETTVAGLVYRPLTAVVVPADEGGGLPCQARGEGGVMKADAEDVWRGRGGLLCDEMGLGKTVELMQLVLCHPCTDHLPALPRRDSEKCIDCNTALAGERGEAACVECRGGIHQTCLPASRNPSQKQRRVFVCDACTKDMTALSHETTDPEQLPLSRATLVVIPTSLLRQWESELRKHVRDALDVQIFLGVKSGYVPRRKLQHADVVLTTYDALRADVYAARAIRTPRSAGRYKKRFPPAPIPLLTLRWHRVAFDESQMLSGRGSTIAEMAGFIHANYRWCVTGTPMKTGLLDAVTMFEMVQLTYRGDPIDWRSLFAPSDYKDDDDRLVSLLRRVMWRTAKADVGPNELDLPPQHVQFVRVRLGPVERYHYQSLLQNVRSVIGGYRNGMTEREMKISKELLITLRQACTHPKIGSAGRRLLSPFMRAEGPENPARRRENALQKVTKKAENPLDMNEVLGALVTKSQLEASDTLRSLVVSTNGLAAVHLLQFSLLPARSPLVDGLVKAIQLYRDVLRISDENEHIAKLDGIQLMHVMFNLNDAFKSVEKVKVALRAAQETDGRKAALETLGSLGRTMREGQLLEQTEKLRDKYIADARRDLAVTTTYYNSIAEKLGEHPLIEAQDDENEEEDEDEDEPEEELFQRVAAAQRRGNPTWWEVGLATLLEKKDDAEKFLARIVGKLIEALPGRGLGAKTLANRLNSFHSLSIVISSELKEVQGARQKFKDTLFQLPGSREPTEQEVAESGQCRGCREFGNGPKCLHCRSEHLIISVERHLYSLQEELDEETLLEPEDSDDLDDDDDDGVYRRADPRAIVNSAFTPQSHRSKPSSSILSRIRYVSEVETILKGLAAVVRRNKDPGTIAEMTAWFERWEEMKEEQATARKVFEAQRSYLASLDEVKMALMRLSVLEDGIDVSDLNEIEARHRVPRGSLGPLRAQFEAEKAVAEAEFCAKRGSTVYLRSLKRSMDSQVTKRQREEDSEGLANCPVCLLEFDDSLSRIAVMACGHVFCCECMLAMIKKVELTRRMETVACPSCRTRCPVDEINFTTTTPQPPRKKQKVEDRRVSPSPESGDVTEPELDVSDHMPSPQPKSGNSETRSSFYDPKVTVQGLFGAKVSATLRLLRGIWRSDESAKVLIFSEWNEVLALMAHSLTANAVFFCNGATASGSQAFANVIEEFKTCDYTNVILLPLRRAGAGLNLTEAQHVILMEPSMDISMEAQAVGRVHRIGQTKPTYVHRVMVNDTIEDNILSLGDQYRGQRSELCGNIELQDAIRAITADGSSRSEERESVEVLD